MLRGRSRAFVLVSESAPHFVLVRESFWPPALLAAGSALLLVGPLVWLSRFDTETFCLVTPVAVLLHLSAWVALLGGAETPWAEVTGWASVALFSVGLLTLFSALPESAYAILGWGSLLLFIPYLPYVFGPVVIAHVAYFILDRRDTRLRPLFLSGLALLLLVSGVALGLQVTGRFDGAAYLCAGLTSPGYGLVAWDAKREQSHSRLDRLALGRPGGILRDPEPPRTQGQHA